MSSSKHCSGGGSGLPQTQQTLVGYGGGIAEKYKAPGEIMSAR
ncbi:MAG: hypothetical protein ABSF97_00950 [Candidatus Sulfotelmatobacter sp.]